MRVEKLGGLLLVAALALCGSSRAAVFQPYVRVAPNLPGDTFHRVENFFKYRISMYTEQFKYLESPHDLTLVISNRPDYSVYRAGELVVPYRFISPSEWVAPAARAKLTHTWWDFLLAVAYFDANMKFEAGVSQSWDIYQESYNLRREYYKSVAAMDRHRERKPFQDGIYSMLAPQAEEPEAWAIDPMAQQAAEIEEIQSKKDELRMHVLEARIRDRESSERVRYADAYLFELQNYFGYLFADLAVAIMHQDPNAMTDLLRRTQDADGQADAAYRSFARQSGLDLNGDHMGYKFSHFFAPIRADLWESITQSGRSREAQLRSLENLFIRMRVVFRDILKRLDLHFKYTSGAVKLGIPGIEFLTHLHLDRHYIADQLRLSYCEEMIY